MTISATTEPVRIHRKDYRVPHFWIDSVHLRFELGEEETLVRAKIAFRRNADARTPDAPLALVGEELELLSLAIDGHTVNPSRYTQTAEDLVIQDVPDRFTLQSEVRIHPEKNTKLMGLYKSSGNFCTQCEAEGFRRITWFLDRPDVMARYTTEIIADPERYPVMLSNGNRIDTGNLPDGRRRVVWEDPFKKPSYLFALVAGDLACVPGSFTTRSGREVTLEVYVEHQNTAFAGHALESLKRAMKWDEDVFGLEYDLDIYMVVAVSDFNMGAMENKGLNVFNSKYVLASPETATDDDYESIEGVIGHEYFHNWTGNRVTCRDWFQLTLKEGLTVFRDQEFSSDMTSRAVKRIQDVRALRSRQFPEDAGPMSHPIRPESYIEMNNFYTATVYEKGAQIIGMYNTLLSPAGFRRGMDLYFERHDGQAVTCDDFRAAMAEANGRDLAQFERWYLQGGTPRLEVRGRYDGDARTYTLTMLQKAPAGHDGDWQPMHVPVRVGLLAPDGNPLPLALASGGDDAQEDAETPLERVLELTDREARFVFTGIDAAPVPSVLRGFSAPVVLEMTRSADELAFLMAHDVDSFNRWDAGQELFAGAILAIADVAARGEALALDPACIDAFKSVLLDGTLDGSFRSLALTLPDESTLSQRMAVIDPDALHTAREFVRSTIGRALRLELEQVYTAHAGSGSYASDAASIARRRTQNCVLSYLAACESSETTALVQRQFESADNMTDSSAALVLLSRLPGAERDAALAAFHARWKDDPLVIDKWFTIQAVAPQAGAPARVRALAQHTDFSLENPNRARALVGAFGMANMPGFHDASGDGYRFVADQVLALDALNPQVASRVVGAFNQWKRFDEARKEKMRAELSRIASREGLSKDVYEIVSRALEA
ncbi:MAG: aminopeptidase N [bacterium]|nr:aminopeptidase N [bacterium]